MPVKIGPLNLLHTNNVRVEIEASPYVTHNDGNMVELFFKQKILFI